MKSTIEEVDTSSSSSQVIRFEPRDSLLTQLIRGDRLSLLRTDKGLKGIRSIYSLILLLLYYYLLHRAAVYSFHDNLGQVHWSALKWTFTNFHYSLLGWVILHLICFAIAFPLGKTYSKRKKSSKWFIAAMVLVVLVMGLPAPIIIILGKTVFFSSAILLVEQIRLQMKVISFFFEVGRKEKVVRRVTNIEMTNNNSPSHLHIRETRITTTTTSSSSSSSTPVVVIPTFKSFVYFLFAPVFIYRISYPRTKGRSIIRILVLSFESLCLLLLAFTQVREASLSLKMVGQEVISVKQLVTSLFPCLIAGLTVHLAVFWVFTHSVLNILGEITKFADRHFYTAFWEEEDPADWYAGSHYDVTIWVREYIVWFLEKKMKINKVLTFLVVLTGVLMIHDLIATVTLGFYSPMFLTFLLIYIPHKVMEWIFGSVMDKSAFFRYIVVYAILSTIWSMTIFSWSLEFYSRENCPPPRDASWLKAFLAPRWMTCMTLTGFSPGSTAKKIASYFVKVV